jgi:hypothetical protein
MTVMRCKERAKSDAVLDELNQQIDEMLSNTHASTTTINDLHMFRRMIKKSVDKRIKYDK